MTQVKDILAWLDECAPFRFKASWDQCGLQVGDPEAVVKRVLVALDPGSRIVEEAGHRQCQCLVTHHPLLFRPLSSVRLDAFPGNVIALALHHGVHLIAAHTNLDVAQGGTNDRMAHLLGLENVEPLETDSTLLGASRYVGLGRIGLLPVAMALEMLAERTRQALGAGAVRVVGDRRKLVRSVALCTGSGGGLVEQVAETGCDVYITGDVKYHEAQHAVEADLAVIDVGHFASERIVVPPVVEYLRSCAARDQADLEVLAADGESDPFWEYSNRS